MSDSDLQHKVTSLEFKLSILLATLRAPCVYWDCVSTKQNIVNVTVKLRSAKLKENKNV